jgi:hypothetical protein
VDDDFVYDGGDCVDYDKMKLKQGDDRDSNDVEFQTTVLKVYEPLDGLEYEVRNGAVEIS